MLPTTKAMIILYILYGSASGQLSGPQDELEARAYNNSNISFLPLYVPPVLAQVSAQQLTSSLVVPSELSKVSRHVLRAIECTKVG